VRRGRAEYPGRAPADAAQGRERREKVTGPALPDEIVATDLDSAVRAELLSLTKPVADRVARHLVATGRLIDEDPALALEHAVAARRLAARIAAVREAVGLAAYRAGEWQTALTELRTYHRMTGRQPHLAVLADCERALGRPERAIDLYRGADSASLDKAAAIELLIVAAGARADLGQRDAAVAMLQVRELTATSAEPWVARLRYAYADALLATGRQEEAREWFARAADADELGDTDAAERLLELDGVVLEEDEFDDEPDPDEAGGEATPNGDVSSGPAGERTALDGDQPDGEAPGRPAEPDADRSDGEPDAEVPAGADDESDRDLRSDVVDRAGDPADTAMTAPDEGPAAAEPTETATRSSGPKADATPAQTVGGAEDRNPGGQGSEDVGSPDQGDS
jgi:hypothetical protein